MRRHRSDRVGPLHSVALGLVSFGLTATIVLATGAQGLPLIG